MKSPVWQKWQGTCRKSDACGRMSRARRLCQAVVPAANIEQGGGTGCTSSQPPSGSTESRQGMLQPQFKPHSIQQVLSRLFQVIPGHSPCGSWDPARCQRCAVVGNSGNLRGAGYGRLIDGHNYIMRINLAPTVGYEEDAGSHTTHHFMYPESAKNLAANVSFVLVPFKTLDLLWITSALSTGQIRFTYAPVKQFLRVDKDKVQIYNPAFFKYIHDHWTRHHGRYPSTGMLVLFFALHVCDEVNVFGFGADSRGNWHHYWEQNRYSGEFRKTGVHDADFEAQIIDSLAKAGKITVFPGK
ncbi:hypothetical protein AAFF_G00421300 [Aldrovandia affinis]|uniref:CMP-N-acetylneuraminate-beta-galactosamide-alpha-2,3-sialyltransferase 2 n=1 Tax=Aldrovandia affinis TaxID=143900 RepID=A0AAD7SA89_9TELE|nr:hypothetical protein AAFF_G00421300 [Aldrovandia affinis]